MAKDVTYVHGEISIRRIYGRDTQCELERGRYAGREDRQRIERDKEGESKRERERERAREREGEKERERDK